jgi:protocatechuate 3,4-dioxygenase alpha subunit
MTLQTTTSQTVGPFFRIGLETLYANDIFGEGVISGERVAVNGRLIDGSGRPIPDAVIEIWQANSHGKYAHPEDRQDKPLEQNFRGFGRIPTDDNGCFQFTTIKPGCVPGSNDKMQAPHLVVGILMRGLLKGLVTRAYFPDEEVLPTDPILELVEPGRRRTLILERSPEHADVFHWEIHMQGENETVFFDF